MVHIKNLKLKVTAQFQDEQIRVSGKNKDDLQKVITSLKAMEFELPLAVRKLPLAKCARCEALHSSASVARRTSWTPR
jgi:hypothetical protein